VILERYAECTEVGKRTLRIVNIFDDDRKQASLLTLLGICYFHVGDSSHALSYFNEAMREINDNNLDDELKIIALVCQGFTWIEKGNYENAEDLTKEAIHLANKIGDETGKKMAFENFTLIREAKRNEETPAMIAARIRTYLGVHGFVRGLLRRL